MGNYAYFIFLVLAFIVGIIILKKVAGCLMKSVLFVIIIAVLVAVYFIFLK